MDGPFIEFIQLHSFLTVGGWPPPFVVGGGGKGGKAGSLPHGGGGGGGEGVELEFLPCPHRLPVKMRGGPVAGQQPLLLPQQRGRVRAGLLAWPSGKGGGDDFGGEAVPGNHTLPPSQGIAFFRPPRKFFGKTHVCVFGMT